MASTEAQFAIYEYISRCWEDLDRYWYFLDSNTYWGKPMSPEDRVHCERVVELRIRAIEDWEKRGYHNG